MHHNTTQTNGTQTSVLASLRRLVPNRPLTFTEALRISELQANRLLELSGMLDAPVPSDIVTALPRIEITDEPMAMSGTIGWNGHAWVIFLDPSQPEGRWRFTLLHEFAHIMNHGREASLFRGDGRLTPRQQSERAADYFAGCVLMPRRLLKRAWGQGIQRTTDLAAHFDVSTRAVEVRLNQVGLTAPRPHCASRDVPTELTPAPGLEVPA